MRLFLGIDFGTSGCRAVAIDERGHETHTAAIDLPSPHRHGTEVEQAPQVWLTGLERLLEQLGRQCPLARVAAIAVDGTSGTVLLTDEQAAPLAPALMYDDGRAAAQARQIAGIAPPDSAAHGAFSTLAKVLWLKDHNPHFRKARWIAHQSDWIAARLGGRPGVSDHNNCIKLGFDPRTARWPSWLGDLQLPGRLLPRVVRPGTAIGTIHPQWQHFGFTPQTLIVSGTTDSTAAVIAAGACHTGDGITVLGSTLVVKILTPAPLSAPRFGVYSQPFGQLWLCGGGSNTGGTVLRHFFSDARITELSQHLDTGRDTGLNYYPLLRPGERFPIADPALPPRLSPRPDDPARFLQGLLEGIAAIEARAYRCLRELGAAPLQRVLTSGGGSTNPAWRQIRERYLGVPVHCAARQQAAYGSALLARRGYSGHQKESS